MENNDFIAGWDDEYNLDALDVIRMDILRHQAIIYAPHWWGNIQSKPPWFVLINLTSNEQFFVNVIKVNKSGNVNSRIHDHDKLQFTSA